MKKILPGLLAGMVLACLGATAQSTWTLDKKHSNVTFSITHLMISEIGGSFKVFDGTVNSKPDFADAKITFTIDVASVSTDDEDRDNHLRSEEFFNAEEFPKMSFQSVMFKKVADYKYKLVGNLTIRDITRSVTFDVIYGGSTNDGYGNIKAGFKARATINRMDYNLKWNNITEAGTTVVSNEVDIMLNLQFALNK